MIKAICKYAKTYYSLISVFMIAIGLFLMFKPNISISVIGVTIGVLLIVYGIIKIIGYYSNDIYSLYFKYDLELGIVMTVLGIAVLLIPNSILLAVSIIMGILILIDGLFKIRISFEAKKFGISKWWVFLICDILTIIVGILLIFMPGIGSRTIIILFGTALLFEGILSLIAIFTMVKIVKENKKIIEGEYYE